MANVYDIGDLVELAATITLRETGAPTNPDNITLTVVGPSGTDTIAMGSLEHLATGRFRYHYPPATPGTYKWRYVATKGGQAMAAEQGMFYVQPAIA